MGLLSRLAAGPIGLVAGGYMTGELEEAAAEDAIQKEDDDRKKNIVDYLAKKLIDAENLKLDGKWKMHKD